MIFNLYIKSHYLLHPCKVVVKEYGTGKVSALESIIYGVNYQTDKIICREGVFEARHVRPILRSLEDLRETDAIHIGYLDEALFQVSTFDRKERGREVVSEYFIVEGQKAIAPRLFLGARDYLIKEGYLVPFNCMMPNEIIEKGWAEYVNIEDFTAGGPYAFKDRNGLRLSDQ